MDVLVTFALFLVRLSSSADASFVEAATPPVCPTSLFDEELVTVTCHQDWDRDGRWFMRLQSSGFPAHPYGHAYESWTDLVLDQQWDITIPIISEEDPTDDQQALPRDVDPVEFLVTAAREERPLGMALNGVPFFSPLTRTGADTVNPQAGEVAANDTLFDECAGSLQAGTGAYGYRVMPPCLHGASSLVPEGGGYEPGLAVIGFDISGSWTNESSPPASPLLGFAMDGRKLYGPYDATGDLAWGLDACNGRWEVDGLNNGITEADRSALYTYRATPYFPYLVGCSGPAGVSLELAAASGSDHAASDADFVVGQDLSGVCPAGSYLSVDTGECEACHAGTYGKDAGLVGGECAGLCPRGYYCPVGTATPTLRCPAGTFGATSGLADSSCSGACLEGYFCLSGSMIPNSHECGSAQFYCPKGSGQRIPVTTGYYTTPEAATGSSGMEEALAHRVRSGQSQCDAGTYCAGGRRRSCPAGTFGSVGGLTTTACSGPCPVGSYCPKGAVEPMACPAGSYGSEEGLSHEGCSGLCAKGHYCPEGSVSAFQQPCPGGSFGPLQGLKDASCAEEHVCVKEQHASCLASLCDAGYYCPPGSASPRANICGAAGVYCPLGSSFPTPADAGHYTYSDTDVDGGFGDARASIEQEKIRTAQAECEPGYYCSDGVRLPCPAGTFGLSRGLTSPFCSGPCPAGYICDIGVADPLLGETCGGAKWYCPVGSSRRLEVGVGNFTIGELPDRRVAQAVCSPGAYCQEGVSRPCPAGTYGSVTGLSSPACSGLCPAGRYCPEGTFALEGIETDVMGIACPAGRYGSMGMGNEACTAPCEAGYYCPESSTSARERECGSAYRFCPPGSGAASNMTTGWYATGGGELTRTGQAKCLATAGNTPPSGMQIAARCPDYTVGWNGTAVVYDETQ